VLPGTGGLTRLVDKRKVRRDIADLFCTNADGVRAERAKAWGLVDCSAPPAGFADLVRARADALAAASPRRGPERGIDLRPLDPAIDAAGYRYRHVAVAWERNARHAVLTVRAPADGGPDAADDIVARGDAWWPLAMARELDDALLRLRFNEPELGLIVLKTEGDAAAVLGVGAVMRAHADHWLVRETLGMLRRTFARLDVSARSLYAVIEPGSCFAGLLFELALAADRTYMLDLPEDEADAPRVTLDAFNFGALPMVNGRARLATRFNDDEAALARFEGMRGQALPAAAALDAGLVTVTPDELDWEDEIRLALEERASLSPDALTGMEANLRFPGAETAETKLFARLSAWQNWVFHRPNATGAEGALKRFGGGSKPRFDWERV
jgi:benzoyl-CoA-dihydrodiol lyase